MSVLIVQGLRKRFGGVHALRGVDLALRTGEVNALLGENGAGKSTLIKILSGIVQADEGSFTLDGQPVAPDSVAKANELGIQTVHQELELALPLSVAENIFMGRLPGRAGRIDWKALYEQASRSLQTMGSKIDPRTPVAHLSISDRQVVEIAKGLARKASFLVLDEPTAALPPSEVANLLRVVRRLRDQGVGILYVTHRLDEVAQIADRATILRDGSVVGSLEREAISRDALVRHILGRDEDKIPQSAPPKSAAPVVECQELASGNDLRGLSFQAAEGEILGFFGLLGAGQSAIGDSLFGLRKARCAFFRARAAGRQAPDAAGGQRLPASPRRALALGMAYVPADRKGAGLATSLQIGENLLMPDMGRVSRWGLVDGKRMAEVCQAAIKAYDIRCAGFRQRVDELSGGNQQKVSVAKWAVRGVRILYLDEPTRGVDVGARVEIYRFVQSLAARGGTCLISSSDAAEIAAIATRVIVMKAGRALKELRGSEITEAGLIAAAL
ncbi:sugar ABC transporter ATP-binding protein [Pigmentiphaga soli]|uniref:Sugar ABC transporter ATP-binding protein n=1 Tax=Pigmentiphaga soli TaxID=1007095 RepID=A0ABP8GZA7_9BURK